MYGCAIWFAGHTFSIKKAFCKRCGQINDLLIPTSTTSSREREREDKNETQFDVVMFSTKWEQLLETALLPCVIYSSSAFYISRPLIFTEVSVLCLITQPCLTLCKPMYCIPPGMYCAWNSPGKNTGVGSCSLLQVIFPTQGSNWGLLHCRRILYQLSYQGSWYGTEVP